MTYKRKLHEVIRSTSLPDKLVELYVSQVAQCEKNGIYQSVDNDIDPDIFEFKI